MSFPSEHKVRLEDVATRLGALRQPSPIIIGDSDIAGATTLLLAHRATVYDLKRPGFLSKKMSQKTTFTQQEIDGVLSQVVLDRTSATAVTALLDPESNLKEPSSLLKRSQPPSQVSVDTLLTSAARDSPDTADSAQLVYVLGSHVFSTATKSNCLLQTVRRRQPLLTQAMILSGARATPAVDAELRNAAVANDIVMTLAMLSGTNIMSQDAVDEVLMIAVRTRSYSLVASIVTAKQTPSKQGLERAFTVLSSRAFGFCKDDDHQNNKDFDLLTLLLCAGAEGEAVAEMLIMACRGAGYTRLVSILLDFGASISYDGSQAMLDCILRRDVALFKTLVTSDRNYAATRRAISRLVLSHWKKEIRLTAVSGVLDTITDNSVWRSDEAQRLVCQSINMPAAERDQDLISYLATKTKHNQCHLCLVRVVANGDYKAFQSLTAQNPPKRVLDPCLRYVRANAATEHRFAFTNELLDAYERVAASAPEEEISLALIDAITENVVDLAYIDFLLYRGKANIRFKDGAAMKLALKRSDSVALVTRLVEEPAIQPLLPSMLTWIAQLNDDQQRHAFLEFVLQQGAYGRALEIRRPHPNSKTIELLIQCQASIDYENGAAVIECATRHTPSLLSILLQGPRIQRRRPVTRAWSIH